MGHSEAASAITSIIKVVLALEKGQIPPTISVNKLSSKIKADEWSVRPVTNRQPWPRPGYSRASVNSFGFGGANAHAVLESANNFTDHRNHAIVNRETSLRQTLLLPISASTQSLLEQKVQDLSHRCREGVNIVDLAYTLAERRSSLEHKGYLLASQDTIADDIQPLNLCTPSSANTRSIKPLCFVFTGQGAQWPQMGKELMKAFPSFLHSIQQSDTVLHLLADPPPWSIQGAFQLNFRDYYAG